jgi:YVTN family beta-propeller protein
VTPASASTTYAVTATIPVGEGPNGVAVDPITGTIYVVNQQDGTMSVIDGATKTVVTTIPLGRNTASAVAVDPVTDSIYVTNVYGNDISVVNGATNTITATIPVGDQPLQVSVDPATDIVYVTNQLSHTVSVINGATNTVTATIAVGVNPNGVGVDPATNTIYVSNLGDNTVSVIDGATNTVTATIRAVPSPRGVGVDPVTETVYVTNILDNTVSVINGITDTVTATVPAGAEPLAVGVDQITDTIYVTNQFGAASSGTVTVINGATRTVAATVPIGLYPAGVGVDPATHAAYVANGNDNGVISVITPSSSLSVITNSLPDAILGTPYSAVLKASGGTPPYSWSVTAGSLPTGLDINKTTGKVSGTPLMAGADNFTVQAADSATPPDTASAALSLTVGGATTTISGTHHGTVRIRSGVTVIADATVKGSVTIARGAVVAVNDSSISGTLRSSGARALSICGTTIHGQVSISATTGSVLIGDAGIVSGSPGCGGDTIHGRVRLSNGTGGFEIGADIIHGAVSVTRNKDAPGTLADVADNYIAGSLSCSGNAPAPVDDAKPNVIRGPAWGQCAALR